MSDLAQQRGSVPRVLNVAGGPTIADSRRCVYPGRVAPTVAPNG
jgi:hypothetical protein